MGGHAGRAAIVAVCVAAAAGIGFAGYGLYARAHRFDSEADKLGERLSAFRRAGLPWVEADLPMPHPAPELDAAPDLEELVGRTKAFDSKTMAAAMRERLTGSDFEGISQRLLVTNDAIAAAERAATKGSAHLPLEWSAGPTDGFRHGEPILHTLRALGIHAEFAVKSLRPERAIKLYKVGWTVARMPLDQPRAATVIAACQGEHLIIDSICMAAPRLLGDTETLLALQSIVAQPLPADTLSRAMQGQVLLSVAGARNLSVWEVAKGAPGVGKLLAKGVPPDVRSRAVMSALLKFWTDNAPLVMSTSSSPWNVCRVLQERSASLGATPGGEVALPLLPNWSAMAAALAEAESRRRCATALLKVVMDQAVTGRWPGTLEDAGITLTDPFDANGPLKLKVSETTITVYSVGPDGIDDGGREADATTPNATHDISATVLLPQE